MKYRFSKLLAVFGVTFLIFTLPFFIEIILNCLAFPLNAQGDLSNWNYYDPTYIESVNNYLFSKIFLMSPYLSAVLGTILFGIASGIFAAFTTAVFFRGPISLPDISFPADIHFAKSYRNCIKHIVQTRDGIPFILVSLLPFV